MSERGESVLMVLRNSIDTFRGTKVYVPGSGIYVDVTSTGDNVTQEAKADPTSARGRLAYARTLLNEGLIDETDYQFVKQRILTEEV